MAPANDGDEPPAFLCPQCGTAVDPAWTYCHVCNYHEGDPLAAGSDLVPHAGGRGSAGAPPGPRLAPVLPTATGYGPPPGYTAEPPYRGAAPAPRLPPTAGEASFEPAPASRGGFLVAIALVVALVLVVGGILVIEAATRPRSNASTIFVPPFTFPSTTVLTPAPTTPATATDPGTTAVPGSALSAVPVPILPTVPTAPVPDGWVERSAPDGSWSVSFPAAPAPVTGTLAPDGWRFVDVLAVRSPGTGATLRFAVLAAERPATVEGFFGASATFAATLAQTTVTEAESTTLGGKGARKFVSAGAGEQGAATQAWAVYDGATSFLILREAPAGASADDTELDQMARSLRTRP